MRDNVVSLADRRRLRDNPAQHNVVQNIRTLADFYGFAAEELALHGLGVSRRRWRRWVEEGKGPVTVRDVARLAESAGLEASDLMGDPAGFRLALTSGSFEAHRRPEVPPATRGGE